MKRVFKIIIVALILIALPKSYFIYRDIYKKNTSANENKEIFIPTASTFDDVLKIMKDNSVLANPDSFDKVASMMKYKNSNVKPGHYIIKPDDSNKEIITMLRSGNQAPMKLTINNVRTLPELAGAISKYIESDSLTILQKLTNPDIQKQYGVDANNMMTTFLPDTYEVFWTSSPEKVIEKLAAHTASFWEKNESKLSGKGLSKNEAYTLASVVEQESNYAPERPTLAGVYLNRIRAGMRLQADPTVKFALQDFAIKRVLLKHLEFDSPYNTYMYAGLPPGPICMPSMSSLNAVINAEENDYIFFCAKPGYNAGHVFAKTYEEHTKNANIYQKWLNDEGIF